MSEIISTLSKLLTSKKLKLHVMKLVKSIDNADDVTQSLLESLLKKPVSTTNDEAFLYRSAHNAAISYLRRSQIRTKYEIDAADFHHVEVESAEQTIETQQKIRLLQSFVEELPEITQEIFTQYFVLGHTQQQVAANLKLHLSTVEKHLSKAKKHCTLRFSQCNS